MLRRRPGCWQRGAVWPEYRRSRRRSSGRRRRGERCHGNHCSSESTALNQNLGLGEEFINKMKPVRLFYCRKVLNLDVKGVTVQ